MVILRELTDGEGSTPNPSHLDSDWVRQVRAHFTRANGTLNIRGIDCFLWGFDVGSSDSSDSDSNSSDSDCVIISPSYFTGKRKNTCRDLVVADPAPLAIMDTTSKFTNDAMVSSFRGVIGVSSSGDEKHVIFEPVGEDELVTTVNFNPPHYFYMYSYLLQNFNLRLPFTKFEALMLRILNVAPNQLHPNSWAFIKAFEVLCSFFGLDPSVGVFFSYFYIKNLDQNKTVSISNRPGRRLFSIFASNVKNYKNSFIKFRCGENFPGLLFGQNKEPLFPFYWTPNSRVIKGVDPKTLRDYEREMV
ncbi:hypothetical protein L195_g030016 [Trifolium pratense]|uniref:Transposase (putative) gypsy type domain-containing protein n=1 Tax=Trifolium pratense TaxID=57577 RepID=A0A2K3L6D7_TRIPR|nr:hypothetical protein L195_g030016 [Trifolium pratense]